ncbi:NUDIX domain-containing protein [Pelagibacterium xiamenense]|uniref:NUDIX domain-containing protein n=1 Tax=Pelagibacterium xiamenense TaxID=2901140 RepID=UPI001E48E2AD|nr:NUDIX domain-containing protein [Pelagibacterium xiamenense]MCD7058281.1 NUDIX domain-containing protein [Pelagibacterium xiamenense]
MDAIRKSAKKIRHAGWGTLTEYEIGYRHADGTEQNLTREVYDHGHAAAVLLVDAEARELTLVRQFRMGAYVNGDADPHLLEVCAGLLDGDTPEACARKEAIEETGIAPKTLGHAFDLYASPGSLTEKVHCFLGSYDATCRVSDGGGLRHEGEDIEVVTIPFADALAMTRNGIIVDAKTVALIQYAALEGLL